MPLYYWLIWSFFINLKKAFDTVNHKILLAKLFGYGIRGNIYNWFRSYLSNRKQYVHLQVTDSKNESVTCGLP